MTVSVAIVGNCQAVGLAESLRWLCPDVQVEGRSWASITTEEQANELARRFESFDIVLSQVTKNPAYGDLQTERLHSRVRRLAMFPKVAFTGFHPDYIRLREVASPLRERHSSLTLAAFLLGVPAKRAAELFNAYVYALAGYFDEYAKAEIYLERTSRYTDVVLTTELPRWRRRGVFVYIPNHPTAWALSEIAQGLASRLGLEARPPDDRPPDVFGQSAIWPVYPEIARQLGVEGSLQFKPPGQGAEPIELDEMIERSYEAYAKADSVLLREPRALELADLLRREGV